MKYKLTLGVLLFFITAQAQDTTYNRWSVDAQFGLNNPVSPMAPAFDSPTFGLMHTGLGVRYMFNTRFGLRLGGGYDQFSERSGTPAFQTDYYRASLEGVVNLGNVLNFDTWTHHFGILLHAGIGYSGMSSSRNTTAGTNNMMHGIIGITPQVKIGEHWSVYLDASVLAHVYQQYTYDFTRTQSNRGIDGYLYNFSIGVQYYIGKHTKHADWASTYSSRDEILMLQERMRQMEQRQMDDDHDGVPNYLDEEPNTPAGTTVDTKGRTVVSEVKDSDSDNIPDDVDDCPFEKGTPAMNGCPEKTGMTNGTGNSGGAVFEMVESSEVKFVTDMSDVSPSFAQMLDGIADVMKANPNAKLNIIGHADDRASAEYNMALSQRRADAVQAYLVSKGIAASRLSTTAMGETQPENPGKTVEARAENRRVEFDVK